MRQEQFKYQTWAWQQKRIGDTLLQVLGVTVSPNLSNILYRRHLFAVLLCFYVSYRLFLHTRDSVVTHSFILISVWSLHAFPTFMCPYLLVCVTGDCDKKNNNSVAQLFARDMREYTPALCAWMETVDEFKITANGILYLFFHLCVKNATTMCKPAVCVFVMLTSMSLNVTFEINVCVCIWMCWVLSI